MYNDKFEIRCLCFRFMGVICGNARHIFCFNYIIVEIGCGIYPNTWRQRIPVISAPEISSSCCKSPTPNHLRSCSSQVDNLAEFSFWCMISTDESSKEHARRLSKRLSVLACIYMKLKLSNLAHAEMHKLSKILMHKLFQLSSKCFPKIRIFEKLDKKNSYPNTSKCV